MSFFIQGSYTHWLYTPESHIRIYFCTQLSKFIYFNFAIIKLDESLFAINAQSYFSQNIT